MDGDTKREALEAHPKQNLSEWVLSSIKKYLT